MSDKNSENFSDQNKSPKTSGKMDLFDGIAGHDDSGNSVDHHARARKSSALTAGSLPLPELTLEELANKLFPEEPDQEKRIAQAKETYQSFLCKNPGVSAEFLKLRSAPPRKFFMDEGSRMFGDTKPPQVTNSVVAKQSINDTIQSFDKFNERLEDAMVDLLSQQSESASSDSSLAGKVTDEDLVNKTIAAMQNEDVDYHNKLLEHYRNSSTNEIDDALVIGSSVLDGFPNVKTFTIPEIQKDSLSQLGDLIAPLVSTPLVKTPSSSGKSEILESLGDFISEPDQVKLARKAVNSLGLGRHIVSVSISSDNLHPVISMRSDCYNDSDFLERVRKVLSDNGVTQYETQVK